MGEFGHVKDGFIGKLDVQIVQRVLGPGGHWISRRDIQEGWPTAQLPFLTVGILQNFGALEVGSHVGVLPESLLKEGLD